MFSLESTVHTEQWYAITWQENGNTCTIERPEIEAARITAQLFANPATFVIAFTEVSS